MKKHDEGYALILVLIVLTVLGLMASFMLSFSLQNVQTQRKYIDRMQDQYAAAGQIEAVVGKLQPLIGSGAGSVNLADTDVSVEDMTVTVIAEHETIKITCTIHLSADAMTPGVAENQYNITGLTAITYTSYEITTVQEVTPDA